MNVTPAVFTTVSAAHTSTFSGIVRGEWYKATRLRAMSIGAVLVVIPPILVALFLLVSNYIPTTLASIPANLKGEEGYFIEQLFERPLALVRDFSGIYLLVLGVLVFGQEFQHGTIRVVLARGVGRGQWLLAKLLALFGIALGALALYLMVILPLTTVAIAHAAGGTAIFHHLPDTFGGDMLFYIISIVINAAASIMLAMAATIIGRSMTFGMGAALLFFPADNVLVTILGLIGHLTQSDFWTNATAYLLGPTLNALPVALVLSNHITAETAGRVATDGTVPLVFYDGTHAMLVALTYMVGFAAISFFLMRQRDVRE